MIGIWVGRGGIISLVDCGMVVYVGAGGYCVFFFQAEDGIRDHA